MTKTKARTYETIKDAATRIGVNQATVRGWIAANKIKAYRPSPRVIRLVVEEVDAMMERCNTDRW